MGHSQFTHTWVTLTGGNVSQAGFLLEVIFVTMVGCGAMEPRPGAFVWGPAPTAHPCRHTGLWEPLLELDDNLRLMKAISTVGSGLQHNIKMCLKYHFLTLVNSLYRCLRMLWIRFNPLSVCLILFVLDLSLVRVRMLLASSYVTPIRDSLLMDTSWSPTCSRPSYKQNHRTYPILFGSSPPEPL